MTMNKRFRVALFATVVGVAGTAPLAWADRDGDRGERQGPPSAQEPKAPHAVQPREAPRGAHGAPSRSAEAPPPRGGAPGSAHRPPGSTPQPVLPREARRPPPPPPGYKLDSRHHHNHYYPPRGYTVPVLPGHHRTVYYHGSRYYYYGGVWYQPYGARFVVVIPPFGIVVPVLPPFYTTIWWGGIPYYYAAGVYYTWYPQYNGYVVTEPPPQAQVQEEAAVSDELFIYPKKGQSEKQQALDRYECHRWSVSQTGFDPTQPGGGVPAAQNASKRADYHRAMKACLEARGYSVQ